MDATSRLDLPFLLASQAQKHVTLNEALSRLDTLVQMSAVSDARLDQPTSPVEGSAYLLPPGKTGADWSLMAEGAVAAFIAGGWQMFAPKAGWQIYVEDRKALLVHDGTGWKQTSPPVSLSWLGVNAVADSTNRLLVSADAELLTHDDQGTGHARKVINRRDTAKTASVLFQSGFVGAAELGLLANTHFSINVSADGTGFQTALAVDTTTRHVGIGKPPTSRLSVYESGAGQDNLPMVSFERDGFFALLFLDTYADTQTTSSFSVQRRARGTTALPQPVQQGDWAGGFAFRAYLANQQWGQTALISASIDQAPTSSGAPMCLSFWTGATSVAERLRITSAGNVGVGTSQPTTRLHVNGPIRTGSYAKSTLPDAAASGAGAIVYVSDDVGGGVLAFSDGTAWRRSTDRQVIE